MAPSELDHHVFARCMKNAGGHALWKMISAKELKPGTCGYFDHNGDWTPIIHILDENVSEPKEPGAAGNDENTPPKTRLESAGYPVFPTTPKMIPDPAPGKEKGKEQWPLKTSDSMKFRKYQATASAAVPAGPVPVSAGIDAIFENEQQEGGILIVDGNVTHHQARPTSNFKIWMKNPEIAKKIMEEYPDTVEKGIWIITKTYTAKRRSVAVAKSKGTLLSFSIGAKVADIAELKPTAEWWNAREEGSWKKQRAAAGDEIVLSASGIWFKQTRFWKTTEAVEKEHKQQWLDAGDDAEPILVSMPNKDGGGFVNIEFVPEPFGDDDDTTEALADRDMEEKPQGDEGREGFQAEEGFSIDDEE